MYWWSVESMVQLFAEAGVLLPKERTLLDAYRAVHHRRLSIGMKLHAIKPEGNFEPLFMALARREYTDKGKLRIEYPIDRNYYRRDDALWCFVLPPLGNAQAAVTFLEVLGRFTQTSLLRNPSFQLQLCTPGKLSGEAAAILAIAFYLGSDTIRVVESPEEYATTFSQPKNLFLKKHCRGVRMVLYGVANDDTSTFDRRFHWWGAGLDGEPILFPELPFKGGGDRTDILAGACSALDIHRFNLVSTLLVHANYGGYWGALGKRFIDEFKEILKQHELLYLLEYPWVFQEEEQDYPEYGDELFFDGLQDLVSAALEDARALRRHQNPRHSLLGQVSSLLDRYDRQARSSTKEGGSGHVW